MPTVTSISCIALARQHLCRRCNASRHYGTRDEREQFRFSSGHGARNLESRTIVRSVVSRSPTIGVVSRAPTVRVERNPFSGSVAIKRRARKSRSTQLRDRKNSHVPVFIYCPDRADSVNQVLSPFGLSIPGYTSFSRAISSRATSREKERKISHGLRLERLRLVSHLLFVFELLLTMNESLLSLIISALAALYKLITFNLYYCAH